MTATNSLQQQYNIIMLSPIGQSALYNNEMKSMNASSLLNIPNLNQYMKQVEYELEAVLYTDSSTINNPLKRLIRAPSKRLRPMFVIAVAHSQGVKIDKKIIQGCAAIELAHIGSLVHDDIIDDASIRWHVPTINSQEGTTQAILIGDYLYAKSFEQAAKAHHEIAMLIGTAQVSLCYGQSLEMEDQFNLARTENSMQKAHLGKTAALFSVSCQIGGICSGLSKKQVSALASFGENFGMAFQLIDDLLDLLSTDELSGKPVGNDISEGIYTLPIILSLSLPSNDSLKSLLKSGKQTNRTSVIDRLKRDGSIKKTIHKIHEYNLLASNALDQLKNTAGLTDLKNLPDTYLKLALKHYVAKEYQSLVTNV